MKISYLIRAEFQEKIGNPYIKQNVTRLVNAENYKEAVSKLEIFLLNEYYTGRDPYIKYENLTLE